MTTEFLTKLFACEAENRPTRSSCGWMNLGSRAGFLGVLLRGSLVPTMFATSLPPANAAPAPSTEAVVRQLKSQDEAVLRVGERLVVNGVSYCGAAGRSAGMVVQRLAQYGADYRAAAASVSGVAALPTITAIVPGGAAATAGLRPRDAIVAIDGHAFEPDPPSRRAGDFAGTSAVLDIIEDALADGRARLQVTRGGRPLTIDLSPRPACRARFDVRAGRSNNASSDGTYVQVSSDLVGQAQGEDELAAILAHELSHSILRHPQRLTGPRPRPRVRDTEIEADRLSVYLLDAAGYSPAAAIAFWRRWGRKNDWGILSDGTHPGWKQRVGLIEAEAAAIEAARADGRTVRPPEDLRPR